MRLNNNLALKRIDVEQTLGGAAASGASTPASRESPVPPVVTQLSKQDISQFKPTNSLSSELSFLEMQDWKEEVLNWFKIANHTNLDISMQKHLLKIVVDPDMWVKACYTFEAEDSHIEDDRQAVLPVQETHCRCSSEDSSSSIKEEEKTNHLHSYMIKMERQGLSAKLNDMGVHKILCHKFMSDEGPAFRKKVCCLKTPTGETNHNPTFKELLNLAALEYRETIMTSENKKQVNQTGGALPKRDRAKKKEGFIKCFLCGANSHKSNACTVDKANLSCTFCQNTGSHNTQACRKKEAGDKKKKSPVASPHRERSQSPAGGRRSQTPAISTEHKLCNSQAHPEQSNSQLPQGRQRQGLHHQQHHQVIRQPEKAHCEIVSSEDWKNQQGNHYTGLWRLLFPPTPQHRTEATLEPETSPWRDNHRSWRRIPRGLWTD